MRLLHAGRRADAGHHDPAADPAHHGGGADWPCRIRYREGSFGLGAGKLRTVFRIVLPSAVPGILAGIILAIGRIVGETAALIYTGRYRSAAFTDGA